MSDTGYAAVTFGKVLVETVSESERAAMVNWLVTAPQVMVLNSHTDEQIADAFATFTSREACGTRIRKVRIEIEDDQ